MSRKHRGNSQSLPDISVSIPTPDHTQLLQAAGDAYSLLGGIRERLGQIDSAYRVIAGSEWEEIDRDLAQVKQWLDTLEGSV